MIINALPQTTFRSYYVMVSDGCYFNKKKNGKTYQLFDINIFWIAVVFRKKEFPNWNCQGQEAYFYENDLGYILQIIKEKL